MDDSSHKQLSRALEAGIICQDQILEAVQRQMTTLDNPGFCLSCGSQSDSCEPDARAIKCETCGASSVYGAQELLFDLTM